MNVFNSLGSNYNVGYIIKAFFKQEKGARKLLSNFLEKKYNGEVVLTYKGRQALTIGLESLNLPENSYVAVTGFTCIAVVDAVKKANLKPVFIDIEKETLNFSAKLLEEKVKVDKNIRAVIIQNTLGYPCNIHEILQVCKKYKLKVVEDLAHCVGATYENGKEAGTAGDVTCLSFSQDKMIDAVSGGATILRSPRARSQKQVASSQTPSFQDKWYPLFTWIIRTTYPLKIGKMIHATLKTLRLLSNPMKIDQADLTDWHAMLALDELRMIEKNLDHRKKIAKVYAENLPPEVLPENINTDKSTNLRFPILVKNRRALIEKLKQNGAYVSDIWYDAPVSPRKNLETSGYRAGECPNSEKISGLILNLPTHKNVSAKTAHEVSKLIKSVWK